MEKKQMEFNQALSRSAKTAMMLYHIAYVVEVDKNTSTDTPTILAIPVKTLSPERCLATVAIAVGKSLARFIGQSAYHPVHDRMVPIVQGFKTDKSGIFSFDLVKSTVDGDAVEVQPQFNALDKIWLDEWNNPRNKQILIEPITIWDRTAIFTIKPCIGMKSIEARKHIYDVMVANRRLLTITEWRPRREIVNTPTQSQIDARAPPSTVGPVDRGADEFGTEGGEAGDEEE